MNIIVRSLRIALPVTLMALAPVVYAGSEAPADTYFSLAVSENSHNHYGENLLYLDFSPTTAGGERHPRTVVSARVKSGAITLDGRGDEWPASSLTTIPGRVMNNYPLSRHYDAVPTPITVGSAFDDEYVYFVVRYTDANHDASVNRNRWEYRGGKWQQMGHVKPRPGTPAFNSVNRDDKIGGGEDEDQLFMMFPIVDSEKHFQDGGLGCAGYCHANLTLTPEPDQALIGDGVSAMHTNYPDDIADLWHWTATRSRPMGTLKDGYLDYGDESYNGRKIDAGTAPFDNNAAMDPFRPIYVSRKAYEAGSYSQPDFYTPTLVKDDLLEITSDMTFSEGVSLPFYVHKPAEGGRADVETAAYYDEENFTWTIEIRRKRRTDDVTDFQFIAGKNPLPPTSPLVMPGDPVRGKELFNTKTCASCHGKKGEGIIEKDKWKYPRNQRVSGPAIRATASIMRAKRLNHLASELKKYEESPPDALMPFVPVTPQEAEDIGAWLRKQYIESGQ